jgi:hypothetical protein
MIMTAVESLLVVEGTTRDREKRVLTTAKRRRRRGKKNAGQR